MTITCATHFTASSSSAVRVASRLAQKRHEPLFLVNVQQGPSDTANAQQLETAAKATLDRQAGPMNADGMQVGVAVLRGGLGSALWRFCTQEKTQLLVVGDTNHLTSALFESPLEQFAYGVDLPVWVVRDEAPLMEWFSGARPLRVMLALDRTQASARALGWITQLAEYGPLDLVAAHVWWPASEYARRQARAPKEDDAHQRLQHTILTETEAALRTLPPRVEHRIHLQVGMDHVSDQLIRLAVDEQVDLIVLGLHPGRSPFNRLWSVSHDVLGLAPMSVVCVPSPREPSVAAPPPKPPRVELLGRS